MEVVDGLERQKVHGAMNFELRVDRQNDIMLRPDRIGGFTKSGHKITGIKLLSHYRDWEFRLNGDVVLRERFDPELKQRGVLVKSEELEALFNGKVQEATGAELKAPTATAEVEKGAKGRIGKKRKRELEVVKGAEKMEAQEKRRATARQKVDAVRAIEASAREAVGITQAFRCVVVGCRCVFLTGKGLEEHQRVCRPKPVRQEAAGNEQLQRALHATTTTMEMAAAVVQQTLRLQQVKFDLSPGSVEKKPPAFAVMTRRDYLLKTNDIICGDAPDKWLEDPDQPTVAAVSDVADVGMRIAVHPGMTIQTVAIGGSTRDICSVSAWLDVLAEFAKHKEMTVTFRRADPTELQRGYARPGDRQAGKPFTVEQVAFMKAQFHNSPSRVTAKEAVTSQELVLLPEAYLTEEQIDGWYGRYAKKIKEAGIAEVVRIDSAAVEKLLSQAATVVGAAGAGSSGEGAEEGGAEDGEESGGGGGGGDGEGEDDVEGADYREIYGAFRNCGDLKEEMGRLGVAKPWPKKRAELIDALVAHQEEGE
jgi:hypothetical protein